VRRNVSVPIVCEARENVVDVVVPDANVADVVVLTNEYEYPVAPETAVHAVAIV
jgi:hypothetical protein